MIKSLEVGGSILIELNLISILFNFEFLFNLINLISYLIKIN